MRLIDADELIKKLEFNSWDIDEWELPHEQVSAGLRANAYDRKTVEDAPTVDAVPVVRCKDCRFYETHSFQGKEFRLCGFGFPTRADDFCSWSWTGRKGE